MFELNSVFNRCFAASIVTQVTELAGTLQESWWMIYPRHPYMIYAYIDPSNVSVSGVF